MDKQSVAEAQSRVQLAEEEARQARGRALTQEEKAEHRRAALEAEFVAKAAQLQAEFDERVVKLDDQAAQKQTQLAEQEYALVWPERHIFTSPFSLSKFTDFAEKCWCTCCIWLLYATLFVILLIMARIVWHKQNLLVNAIAPDSSESNNMLCVLPSMSLMLSIWSRLRMC